MSKTIITKKEIEVPIDALIGVAALLADNSIQNTITGSDEDEETVTLEVSYTKEEKSVMAEIKELIDEHDEDED